MQPNAEKQVLISMKNSGQKQVPKDNKLMGSKIVISL